VGRLRLASGWHQTAHEAEGPPFANVYWGGGGGRQPHAASVVVYVDEKTFSVSQLRDSPALRSPPAEPPAGEIEQGANSRNRGVDDVKQFKPGGPLEGTTVDHRLLLTDVGSVHLSGGGTHWRHLILFQPTPKEVKKEGFTSQKKRFEQVSEGCRGLTAANRAESVNHRRRFKLGVSA